MSSSDDRTDSQDFAQDSSEPSSNAVELNPAFVPIIPELIPNHEDAVIEIWWSTKRLEPASERLQQSVAQLSASIANLDARTAAIKAELEALTRMVAKTSSGVTTANAVGQILVDVEDIKRKVHPPSGSPRIP